MQGQLELEVYFQVLYVIQLMVGGIVGIQIGVDVQFQVSICIINGIGLGVIIGVDDGVIEYVYIVQVGELIQGFVGSWIGEVIVELMGFYVKYEVGVGSMVVQVLILVWVVLGLFSYGYIFFVKCKGF